MWVGSSWILEPRTLRHELELADDDRMVDLGDDVRLEFLYRRLERSVVLREHEAPGRVAVETVDRLESGNLLLLAQNRLDALWVVARNEPCRLVAHEIVVILPKNPDVPLRGRRTWRRVFARTLSRLPLSALHDYRRNLDEIACLERIARNPHALAVDPDAAPVNGRLRRAAGKRKLEDEKILQYLGIRLVDGEGYDARGMLVGAAHRVRP